jgi:ribosomal protein L37E
MKKRSTSKGSQGKIDLGDKHPHDCEICGKNIKTFRVQKKDFTKEGFPITLHRWCEQCYHNMYRKSIIAKPVVTYES